MNARQLESIEVRVARVGGEMADLLEKVRDILPDEYRPLMEASKVYTDECRRVRNVARDIREQEVRGKR